MSDSGDLLFQYESDILIVRASGREMIEHMESAIQRIAEAIAARPVKTALVDLRGVTGSITFMDRYGLGLLAGQHLRMVPVAVLANPDQLDQERIGRMVANNRGANIEIFTELAAAHQWLADLRNFEDTSTSGP